MRRMTLLAARVSIFCLMTLMVCSFEIEAQTTSRPRCHSQLWKGPRDLTKQQWVATLSALPRDVIRELAWGELLAGDRRKPVFPILLIYLAKTESRNLLSGYFEGILYLMNPNIQWRKVAEQWHTPINLKRLNRHYWTLEKLCNEFERAGGKL